MKPTTAVVLTAALASAATAGVCFLVGKPLSSPTIDGSTEEAFKASLDAVKWSLPKARHEEFEKAMAKLVLAAMVPSDVKQHGLLALAAMSADPGAISRRVRSRLDGMTAIEVLAVATDDEPRSAASSLLDIDFSLTGLAAARMNANESAAIATLKNIASAQAQLQASGAIDANDNGAGEYGFFAELAGGSRLRNDSKGGVGTDFLSPPYLSDAFGAVEDSRALRCGYVFQMFLPARGAMPAAEAATGGAAGVCVDASMAEVLWMCYAWPTSYDDSGRRAFFVNQSGDVLACRNETARYDGDAHPPAPDAAFWPTVIRVDMGSTIAANATGRDGERWLVVN